MNPPGDSQNPGGLTALGRLLAGRAVVAWLLGLLTLAIFWPVLRCDFVNYDDPAYYYENQYVLSDLSLGSIRWALTTNTTGNWHPVTWLSLMADAQLFGTDAFGAHLTNLLLHVAATVLLFLLLRRMTGAHWRSAVVAGLFALHPLHVESVAWVSERKDVLSAVFGVLTLWFYFDWQKAKREHAAGPEQRAYWLTVLCLTLGLMSKPMLVTLPCVMLLLDLWPLNRINAASSLPGQLKALTLEKIPFFGLCVLSSVMTFWVQHQGGNVRDFASVALPGRLENAPVAYVRYLGKTFWPMDLTVFYPHPGGWPKLLALGAIVLLAGVTAAAVWQWRKRPFLLVGWLWFVGMLVPVIGLVQVGSQAMADRYSYLPHIGLFIALVWLVGDRAAKTLSGKILPGVAVMALAACAVLTRAQVGVWKNTETLFRHTLAVDQKNRVARYNLSVWLAKEGRFAEAAEGYETLLKLDPASPDSWRYWYNCGGALAKQGNLAGAVEKYQQARKLAPDHAEIVDDIGVALDAQGKTAEAIAMFENALQLDPNYANAHNNLAAVLYAHEKYAEAEPHFRAATRLAPNNAQWLSNLGDTLARLNRTIEAAGCYQQALQLAPGNMQLQRKLQEVMAPTPAH